MNLQGKVAIVTGASRGIGRATALELAARGADVTVNDTAHAREGLAVVDAIERLGRRALWHLGDVSDRQQVRQLIDETAKALGPLDIMVCNAAYMDRCLLLDLDLAEVERTWGVCLWGTLHCSQLAARQMVQHGEGGNIVLVSSVLGSRPATHSSAYNAAKAAINQMARSWALELAPHHIRVNAVEPGWTDTVGEREKLGEETLKDAAARQLLKRLGRPEDIAKGIVYLVSDDASWVTGSVLRIDGGGSLRALG